MYNLYPSWRQSLCRSNLWRELSNLQLRSKDLWQYWRPVNCKSQSRKCYQSRSSSTVHSNLAKFCRLLLRSLPWVCSSSLADSKLWHLLYSVVTSHPIRYCYMHVLELRQSNRPQRGKCWSNRHACSTFGSQWEQQGCYHRTLWCPRHSFVSKRYITKVSIGWWLPHQMEVLTRW